MKFFRYLFAVAGFVLTSFIFKEDHQKIIDYFSFAGPVKFNNTSYKLSWSAHPNAAYYKQEYLPAGEKPETYNQMLLAEAALGRILAKEAMKIKTDELDKRKKNDPVVTYLIKEDPATGDCILDFTVGQVGPGNSTIVEWDAYRYCNLKKVAGQNGIFLFGYSKRSYGKDIPVFLNELKINRGKDVNTLLQFSLPSIKLSSAD